MNEKTAISACFFIFLYPAIEDPWRLQGQGFLLYSDSKWPAIRLPWYNGVSFRTRQERSVLMTVEVASERPVKISMEVSEGHKMAYGTLTHFEGQLGIVSGCFPDSSVLQHNTSFYLLTVNIDSCFYVLLFSQIHIERGVEYPNEHNTFA